MKKLKWMVGVGLAILSIGGWIQSTKKLDSIVSQPGSVPTVSGNAPGFAETPTSRRSIGPNLGSADNATERKAELIQQKIENYSSARKTAFFREDEYVRTLISADHQFLDRVSALLSSPPQAPSNTREIRNRMAAIDLLNAATVAADSSSDQNRAHELMQKLLLRPVAPEWSVEEKRVILAEKYDLLVHLVRRDQVKAFDLFQRLEAPKLREVLKPALIGGLVDTGLTREEAVRRVERL